jgi:hypothetical protein
MITKEVILESPVTKENFIELSQFHNTSCVSIYIPAHRSGVEALRGEDALILKNQVKEIKNKLADKGMNGTEAENFMRHVTGLVENHDIWRHQSDGMAIFLAENFFQWYSVPIKFESFNYLSSEFYLLPLTPLFSGDGQFHLLTLKKNEVRFYEGTKFGIGEIDISDSVPRRLEDRVGYDYEQKQMQYRSQLGGRAGGSFHGHGEGEAKDKNELLLFFRAIDKGIMTRLHDFQEPPLLLCCLDYYYPIYKEANTYKNLYPDHISCNPADLDLQSMHRKAWEMLQPYFDKSLHERKEKFLIAIDKGKSSSDTREIIPAAVSGKIDTLFIGKNKDIFGVYNPVTGELTMEEEQRDPNVSLMNLAAKKVFEQNGNVYLLNWTDMPDPTSEMNALFRY